MSKKKNEKQKKKGNPPKLQRDTDADKKRKLEKQRKRQNRPNLQEENDAYERRELQKRLQLPKYEVYKSVTSKGKHKISSGNNEANNPVTPGCNQGEKEDINLPHSSSSGSSAACASGQKAKQKGDSLKEMKNINLPNSPSKKPSSLYNTEHQVYQKNETSKKTKKTKNDRIPPKEKSQIEPNLPVLKGTKAITENTKLSSNIDEARQSCSQSVPIKYSDNKKCQKDDQALTQVKAENKATAKVETLEPDKSMELVSNTLKIVPQKEHIQTKQKRLSPVKGRKKGIMGRIEVLPRDKSVNKSDTESSLSCEYEKGSGKIFIKDQNIKISIEVTEGIQVVFKPRTRPVTDLVEDVKSSSGTLEGYSTERPEDIKTDLVEDVKSNSGTLEGHATAMSEEIKIDPENYCKPTSDTKCDQTVEDQATGVTATNTLIGSEQHGQTGNDPNQGSSSVGEFPKERDSSRITSVHKNIQRVSNEYEKDIQAVCEEFGRKMENYIKRNSLKSSDI